MKGIVDDGIGSCGQEPFGKRLRLRKQGPRPVPDRQVLVSAIPRVSDGNDVENGEPLNTAAVVERQSIGNATAAISLGDDP